MSRAPLDHGMVSSAASGSAVAAAAAAAGSASDFNHSVIGHPVRDSGERREASLSYTRMQQRVSTSERNALSVRMELQADCFAGVWGYHAKKRNLIEPGDFEAGLRAAAAIGDDRLQSMSQGHVQPESWTHGSSEQRATWLRRGLQSGDPNSCDTFAGERS